MAQPDPPNPRRDEDLITAPDMRRDWLGGVSESWEWRAARRFPDFPEPIYIGARKFYRVGDVRRFVENRAAESRARTGEDDLAEPVSGLRRAN
jgi:predicted DNA-binding transcriptional regulator AlpA